MSAPIPASLDSNALALRLAELAGEEREVQVDFLLHLAVFDARRAYVEAGYPSLWTYCLEVLHLREGAAGRRIGAMRVLVRFPRLEGPLRDGRLSLSTLIVLGPVLREENVDALLARAAFRTKREVEELVVSLKPRPEPALEAVAQDRWSLRVTVDRELKDDLEMLRCLLAHKVPDGDLTKVLHEAIRCAVEKHGKRRGAVSPDREAIRPAPIPKTARTPSAAVRREVWGRDGGRCTFVARDGRRCDGRFKLEFDHIDEDGPPTAANL